MTKAKAPKTVLLYPTKKEGSTDIASILKKEVAHTNSFNISNVRRLQNNSIAVDCSSEENRSALLSTLQSKPSFQESIRPIQVERKLTQLITYGYLPETTKEEIEEGLNRNFDPSLRSDLKVLFPNKGKTGKSHWVFQAHNKVCNNIKSRRGKILF